VGAYQRVQPWTIREHWAVAITLRVVLVENLRRLAERVVPDRAARQEADALADRLLELANRSMEPAATILRQFEGGPLAPAFAVQLVQRLRDQDPVITPALQWLEQHLGAHGFTTEIVRVEHQRQAAMNVTVRNVITSMRLISAFDWAEFFESVSLVDAILWTDSGFAAPDFVTRDRYRRAIEELARYSPHDEREIARRAVFQAKRVWGEAQASGDATADRRTYPGYYLIANGRVAFEQELGFRMPIKTRLRRAYLTNATSRYLATIAIVSGLILTLFLSGSGAAEVGVAGLLLVGLLALVPASDLAIALVNREVTELLGPRVLPRLALRDGLPADLRTLVVVPTLLIDPA
jgi:cyclic beta-1,2-glucan synthetase